MINGMQSVFIGFTLVGLGVSMPFGQAGPGIILGMGAGFIAAAILSRVDIGECWSHALPRGSAVLILLGASFILGWLYMLGFIWLPPRLPDHVVAATIVLLGFYFILKGLQMSGHSYIPESSSSD